MVKLRNIHRVDVYIVCQAYVEDCAIPVQIKLKEDTCEFQEIKLPAGYEWCDYHIAQAKHYLIKQIGKPIESPSRNIVWG